MAYKPYQEDRRTCGENIRVEIQRLKVRIIEHQRIISAGEQEIMRVQKERDDPTVPYEIRRETDNTIDGIEKEMRNAQQRIDSLTRQITDLQNDLYIRRCPKKFN